MTTDSTITQSSSPKVYVIHENGDWLATLRAALAEAGIPFEEWDVGTTHSSMDMSVAPPEGVFYNIVSPSSHKRGHRFAMEMGAAIVAWLEHHGRRVVNGSQALNLELSKVRQDLLLERFGIAKPNTVACIGRDSIISSIQKYRATEEGGVDTPFLLKHNRGGSGLGVRLFRSVDSAEAYVRSEEEFLESVDGITLVTDFVDSPEAALYRLEFVNGRSMYSVRVDTSAVVNADSSGPINNCPADSCNIKKAGGKKAAAEEKKEEPETKHEPVGDVAIAEIEDEDEFDEKAAEADAAGKASVVYFGASWCKNCRVLKPSVKQFAGEFAGSAVFMQADVDEASELAERLEVTNIPHVALVRDGEVVATHTGADASALKSTLTGALGKSQAATDEQEESEQGEEEEQQEQQEQQEAQANTGKEIGNCPLKASLDKFRIIKDFHHPVIPKLERMVQSFDSGVSGVEIIIDADNEAYVIDVNCINTNYNTRAEAAAGLGAGYGIARVRDLLISELRAHYPGHYSAVEAGAEAGIEAGTEVVTVSSDSEIDSSDAGGSDSDSDDENGAGGEEDEVEAEEEEEEEVTLTLSPLLDTSALSEKLWQLQTATAVAKAHGGDHDPTDVSPERTPTLSYYTPKSTQPGASRPTNFWLDSLY